MLVLKLVYCKEFDFFCELTELKDILKKKKIIIGIVESMEANKRIIKILCDDSIYNESIFNKICLYISNIIYKHVIYQYQSKEMYDFLTENYYFLKHEELLEVEKKIMKVLIMEEKAEDEIFIYCNNKINLIIEKIKECIEENREINIDGFITFRMRELREDFEEIIDRIVERYIVEKEYEEFIRLLKYFVDIQDSKIEEVDIYINPLGVYTITDGKGTDIFSIMLKELSDSEVKIDNANIEDVLISGLITNAPKRIIIHGVKNCNNKEFLNTILKVFGERVCICEKCDICVPFEIKC